MAPGLPRPLSMEERDWASACGGRNFVAPAWITVTQTQAADFVPNRDIFSPKMGQQLSKRYGRWWKNQSDGHQIPWKMMIDSQCFFFSGPTMMVHQNGVLQTLGIEVSSPENHRNQWCVFSKTAFDDTGGFPHLKWGYGMWYHVRMVRVLFWGLSSWGLFFDEHLISFGTLT